MRRGTCIIVNADDLGLHEDINHGIYLAHTRGVVTSASVVACGEAFDHAVDIIDRSPELDLGVHLTLIEERPLCPPNEIPSLVGPDGRFLPSYRPFTARVLLGAVSPAEIRRELEAQIKRVVASGRRISHLDSHQHIHLLPPVWQVARGLALDYGIRWIRVPHFASLFGSRRSMFDPFFRIGLNVLSSVSACLSQGVAGGIRTPGLHLSGRLREADLLGVIAGLEPGLYEIVTHPGVSTRALSARYRWDYEWSTELVALTSPRIVPALRAHGISLTQFSDC